MADNFQLNVDPFGLNKQLLGSSSPYGGTKAASPPKLSKTEMNKIAQAQQEAIFNQETASISNALSSSPFWIEGSTQQKADFLKHWDENNWKPFAEQRWGADYASNIEALSYKNAVLNPLNTALRQQKKETEGIVPWLARTQAGAAASLDRALTATIQGNALGVASTVQKDHIRNLENFKRIRDGLLNADTTNDPYAEGRLKYYNDRIAEIEQQMDRGQAWVDSRADKLRQAQEMDAAWDAQRLEENAAYRNYQIHGQELDYLYPDSSTLARRVIENPLGAPGILLSEAIQQAPNMLPPIIGGGVGTLIGGPVGGTIGLGIGSATIVGGSVVNDVADEINNTPIEMLSQTPRYQQLAAQGLDDQQIRNRMTQDAAASIWLPAAGLGAATSVLSPEALFLAKSPLSKLLSGQLARRVTQLEAQGLDRAAIQQTLIKEFPKSALKQSMVKHVAAATSLSTIEEAGEEGTEQWLQNNGWNVATGDNRDPFAGVRAAAITGGLVSLPIGAVGGITGTRRENAAVARYEQQRQAEARATAALAPGMQQVGGFNVLRSNPNGTVTPLNVTNPHINPEMATRVAEGTQFFREAITAADAIIASQQVPDAATINKFVSDLYEAEQRGIKPETIENTLTRVQARAAFPPDSNVNVHNLYENYKQTRTAAQRQDTQVRSYVPKTYEEQRTALENAQANIQAEITQLQEQLPTLESVFARNAFPQLTPTEAEFQQALRESTDQNVADRVNRLDTLQQLNQQITQSLIDLETAQTAPSPETAQLAEGTTIQATEGTPQAQIGVTGNQTNRAAKLNELRRQQAEGTWTPEQNTQLTQGQVEAVQSENMTVTLPPDADNATAFDYVRNELINAGRDPEMAAVETVILNQMLDTLGGFTGESRAQILQRLNFGVTTDVSAVVDSYNQAAFVGSPYHFDRFSTDRIGSGEGSQMEGWGLYAAELENIAKGYAYREAHNLTIKYGDRSATRVLAGRDEQGRNIHTWTTSDGLQTSQASILAGRGIGDPTVTLMDEIASTYFISGKQRALDLANNRMRSLYLQLDGDNTQVQNSLVEVNRLIEAIRNDEFSVEHDAQVYKIEIPDNEYLLWDAPLTEQPAYVLERLDATINKMVADLNRTMTEYGMSWTTYRGKKTSGVTRADILGQDLYERLALEFDSPRSASLFLSSLGIQGNKYLDGMSRAKGHGTYNYVIFNDQAIQMLDTFYQNQGRGRIDFLNDGTARIIFGNKADASTAVHEFQHFFINEALRILNDPTIEQSTQKAQLVNDMRSLADFAGIGALEDASNPNAWTREAHERVATAFEAYLRDGKAPTPELASLFERMKQLLTQLYQRMRDIIREPLSPQVRAAFDKQLTGYINEQFRQTADQAAARADRRSAETLRSAETYARQLSTTTAPAGAAPAAGPDATVTGARASGTAYADTGALAQDVQPDQQIQRGAGERADRRRGGTVVSPVSTTADTGQRVGVSEAEQRTGNVRRTEDISESALADDGTLKPAMVLRREELIREYIATATVGVEPEAISPELRATAELMADYTLSLEFGPTEFAHDAYAETIEANQQEVTNVKVEALQQAEQHIPTAVLPKHLAGAKPRYYYGQKQFTLTFISDIDRAAYIVAGKKPSKHDVQYLNFVMNTTGLTAVEAREYGSRVRETIKNLAKHATPGTLTIPVQVRRTVTRSFFQAEHIMAGVEAELLSDPNLQHTAMATLNGTEEETIILHSGSMLPEVSAQLDGTRVNDLEGDTQLTAGNPPQAIIPVVEPTPAQEAAQKQVIMDDIFMLLDEAGVSLEGSVITNPDGSINVALVEPLPTEIPAEQQMEAVSQIDRISQENTTALIAGRANQQRRQQEMERRTAGLSRTAGRWSNIATAAKEKFNFTGARIQQMFNHIFPSIDGNFNSNAGFDATAMLQTHMAVAQNTISNTVLQPIDEFIVKTANLTGFDNATVRDDIGYARTYLHIIESEPLMRIQLETTLQKALETGDARAINAAQAELDSYIAMQTAPDPDVVDANGEVAERVRTRAFGGMPLWEAQQLLYEIVAKYAPFNKQVGGDLLATGVQIVGDGYQTLTNIAGSNGLIDAETVAGFKPYNFYSALYTDQEHSVGTENDLALFMPNAIYRREGSESPAIDSITALDQYANRMAMNLGQTEFVNQLNLAYEKLLSEGLSPEEIQARWGLVRELYNPIRARADLADIVGRVLVEQEDGTANIVRYIYGFDRATHPEMKKALRSLFKPVKYTGLLGGAASFTRFMGRTMTYYRPLFPAVVAARDTVERFSYLPTKNYQREDDGSRVSGTQVAIKTVAYMLNPAHQIGLAKRFITGRANPEHMTFDGLSKLDQRFEEWNNTGGNFNISHTLKKNVVKDVKQNMLKATWDKSGGKIGDFLAKYSDYFYSQPGFAQYNAMRDLGISVKDSVAGVYELMNMRHQGEWTGKLSWAFPFMNSITQTAGQMMGALGIHSGWGTGNPHMLKNAMKGWGMLMAMSTGMSMLAPLVREALGYDDDFGLYYKMDMMPIGQLSTFIPIPLPGGGFFKFPTGFGLAQIAAVLAIVRDRTSRGVMDPKDAAFAVVGTFAKNIVPNSAPAYAFSKDPTAYIMQTISPVWLAPVMQIAMNRSYSGAPVSYAKQVGAKDQRLSDTGSMSTAGVWKDGVKLIYDLTLGVVDMAPEQLRTFVNGYTTGVLQAIPIAMEGNDFTKVDGFESSRDQLGPFWSMVGASVWYGPEVNTTSRAFYDMLDHYNDRIKRAGIHDMLTGSGLRDDALVSHKSQVLSAAGFNQQEITDYLNVNKVLNHVNQKVTPVYKDMLNEWKRKGGDIEIMKNIWQAYSAARVEEYGVALQNSYYYSPDYQRRWGIPNKSASDAMRSSYY